MRYLLPMLMLALSACASDKPTGKSFSGLTEPGYVRVIGTGKNFEDAKTNGFRTAIEIIVGSIVISDAEVKSNQLIRDEIAKHSAGYIDDYKIISNATTDFGVSLVMDINVKSSKIHERVLGKFKDQEPLNGSKMTAQFQTYNKERESGDNVLASVLNDLSTKGFTLTKGDVKFLTDKDRNAIIMADYSIFWNYNYLVALNEILKKLEDSKSNSIYQERVFIQSKDPKAWLIGQTDRYYFNDGIRADLIKSKIRGSIYIMSSVYDDNGKMLFSSCSEPLYMMPLNKVDPLIIRGNEGFEGQVMIKVHPTNPNYTKLGKARKVELTYTTGSCYNFS